MDLDTIRGEIQQNISDDYSPVKGSGRSLPTYDVETADEFDLDIGDLGDDEWFDWQWLEEATATRPLEEIIEDWNHHLEDRTIIGVDGGSTRIIRDRVHFIESQAGLGIYDSKDVFHDSNKVIELENGSCFFLIDSALASESTKSVKFLTRNDVQYSTDASWVTWNPASGKDPGGQSVGLEARLRALTEIGAWDSIRKNYNSGHIDLVIFDGSIFPGSTKAEGEDDVLGDTLKPLYDAGFAYCGLVKQTQINAFVQKLSEEIDEIDPRRFASDISFLRSYLSPGEATPFFVLNITGPKQVGEEEWMPVNTYFKTSTNNVFRLEIPAKFYREERHLEILRQVVALTEQNDGQVPIPIQYADSFFGYNMSEREQIAASIESLFQEEKGISLYRPYREAV
jgi:hypothetical protein